MLQMSSVRYSNLKMNMNNVTDGIIGYREGGDISCYSEPGTAPQ